MNEYYADLNRFALELTQIDVVKLSYENRVKFNVINDVIDELSFKNESKLYVNRVRNVIAGTQKDVYSMDFSSRELFANEQSRVVKRYDGKISENVKKILTEATSAEVGIKTKKKVNVDETAINYNFIGNDRKPFYICTWLASKSVPSEA